MVNPRFKCLIMRSGESAFLLSANEQLNQQKKTHKIQSEHQQQPKSANSNPSHLLSLTARTSSRWRTAYSSITAFH